MTVKRPSFEIAVVKERCKECLMCINVCPKNILERGEETNSRGYRVPFSPNPEECVGCRICEYVCPDFAIFIKPSAKPIYRLVVVGEKR